MSNKNIEKKNHIHLDCTLRDGGYYNNWDFSNELVQSYLKSMSDLDIDYIEIGLRSLKNDSFKGPYAYSTDSLINELKIPENLKSRIGVMINGNELKEDLEYTLNQLFVAKKNSPVTLVRIACHFEELISCLPAVKWLKNNGYLVGFNLMQISNVNLNEISYILKEISKYDIDVLYFADSLGSLLPKDVETIVQTIQKDWSGDIGIHAHDNMGYALNNTLTAHNNGVKWLDSTVTGMGRGPGNTQTEFLYLSLNDETIGKNGNSISLLETIENHFNPLKKIYSWGTNPFYYLAGKFKIHPTYIQKLIQDSRYKNEDILTVIEFFKEQEGSRFSKENLDLAINFFKKEINGSWYPKKKLENKSVLILGTGPDTIKYENAVIAYIKKHNPFVIALNSMKSIPEEFINLRIACHPTRILADCKVYKSLSTPLITPLTMLPTKIKEALKEENILDYGLKIQKGVFKFDDNFTTIPFLSVIAYCLGVITAGKAKEIFLIGFNGYPAGDIRNNEMIDLFRKYQSTKGSIPICTLTPNKYHLNSKSIFAFN